MKKLIFIFLLFCKLAPAQHESFLFNFQSKKDENKFWLITGAMFLNGAADAYHDLTLNNYNYFEARHPKANKNFYDPSISWMNKYKNKTPSSGAAFFGSRTIFVGVTDFYHLTKFVQTGTYVFSISVALSGKDRIPLKNITARMLWFYGIKAISFNLIDRQIYKHY